MKISSKGQVTLPREVRHTLGTEMITYSIVDGVVTLLPVRDVGGSLSEYAPALARDTPFEEMRRRAWDREHGRRNRSRHP